MAASVNDISGWFDTGLKQGSAYMVVATDTFDMSDYPVYVEKGVDPHAVVEEYRHKEMSKVMEVYDLGMSKSVQMTEHRAWHLPEVPVPDQVVGMPDVDASEPSGSDAPCPAGCDHDLFHGLCFPHGEMKWVGRNCECPPRRSIIPADASTITAGRITAETVKTQPDGPWMAVQGDPFGASGTMTAAQLAESSRFEGAAGRVIHLTMPHMVTVVLRMSEQDAAALRKEVAEEQALFLAEMKEMGLPVDGEPDDLSIRVMAKPSAMNVYSADVVSITELPEEASDGIS